MYYNQQKILFCAIKQKAFLHAEFRNSFAIIMDILRYIVILYRVVVIDNLIQRIILVKADVFQIMGKCNHHEIISNTAFCEFFL